MRMIKKAVIVLLFLSTVSIFAEVKIIGKRYSFYASHRNPKKSKKSIQVLNVIDGNIILIAQYKDLHSGQDSEFRIYSVVKTNRKFEIGEVLLKIKTSDDYCKTIQLKDIDGDKQREILLTTITKDDKNTSLLIVRYNKENKTFSLMKPDKPYITYYAEYSFTAKSKENPPEFVVVAARPKLNTIFELPIKKIRGRTPEFWLRQVYFIKGDRLELFESRTIESPFYVLNKFISAAKKRKMFSAYRYSYLSIRGAVLPYHLFRKLYPKRFPFLFSKKVKGKYIIKNWYLDYYKKARRFGWMQFRYSFTFKKRKLTTQYRVYMKKVYNEWKVTRLVRERVR